MAISLTGLVQKFLARGRVRQMSVDDSFFVFLEAAKPPLLKVKPRHFRLAQGKSVYKLFYWWKKSQNLKSLEKTVFFFVSHKVCLTGNECYFWSFSFRNVFDTTIGLRYSLSIAVREGQTCLPSYEARMSGPYEAAHRLHGPVNCTELLVEQLEPLSATAAPLHLLLPPGRNRLEMGQDVRRCGAAARSRRHYCDDLGFDSHRTPWRRAKTFWFSFGPLRFREMAMISFLVRGKTDETKIDLLNKTTRALPVASKQMELSSDQQI